MIVCQAAPLCPAVGQRALSVAQVVDRLRSGSAASAAEACVTIGAVVGQCKFAKERLGKDLRCAPLATVAVGAGLITLLVGLLAKGGHTAGWACRGLVLTYTSGRTLGMNELTCCKGDIVGARAAFLAAGGVEAAVNLLTLPLRHPCLAKIKSVHYAAGVAVNFFDNLAADFNTDRGFKIRCIDAGIVPPLLRLLQAEGSHTALAGDGPNFVRIISQLCWDLAGGPESVAPGLSRQNEKVVTSIVTAFMGGGIAPILVGRLQLPAAG